MAYTKQTWLDRVGTFLNRFTKSNENLTSVELVNNPGTITQAGTAFSASRMNHIEDGIEAVSIETDESREVVGFTTLLYSKGLSQIIRQWNGMTTKGTDVYACVNNGDIYKQTGGIGNFAPLSQVSRQWWGMTTKGSDVYACAFGGDIYKQTGGTGDFVPLSQDTLLWTGMASNGVDVYACVNNGDIYKQTGGIGNFAPLSQVSRQWTDMTTKGTDVYACVSNGDIYKQTGGTGDFAPLSQGSKEWNGMTSDGVDVYACVSNGDIYKQTGGTGDFSALLQASKPWAGITIKGSDVYACAFGGDIYKLDAVTGSTLSITSDAVLPSIPIGSRRRIYNSGTSTIKLYATYPDYIDGLSYIRIMANDFVEIEKFATNVIKTTGKHAGEYFIANSEAVVNTNGTSVKTIVGDGGAPILALTAATYYDCTLPRALLPNETVTLQFRSKTTGIWVDSTKAGVNSLYLLSLAGQVISDSQNQYIRGTTLLFPSSGVIRYFQGSCFTTSGSSWDFSSGVDRTWAQIIAATDGYDAWRIAIR